MSIMEKSVGFDEEAVLKLAEIHGKPVNFHMSYGTAGFRGKAIKMDHIFFRMGLVAVLRSKMTKSAIGVMVTASHNPAEDNGVKLVDPAGEMLNARWEKLATDLANISNDILIEKIKSIIALECINIKENAKVFLARDTRPSSLPLSNSVKDGVVALKGNCKDFGLLTTPQLHFMVYWFNTGQKKISEDLYYDHFSKAFCLFLDGKTITSPLTVDCANGVGALKLKKLYESIDDSNLIQIVIVNDGVSGNGRLNENCGADYVKIQQHAPVGLDLKPYHRYASFDGDADRIVYYTLDKEGKFKLLDGDKIASLITLYINELLSQSKLDLKLGMVQTAYANGSSTKYVQETLNVTVAFTKTGVKHLHHKALDFDIGVYFEANGHGTVTVKKTCHEKIKVAIANSDLSIEEKKAVIRLKTFLQMINETVGDALCDMLAVEAILHKKNWSVKDWLELYSDLPNRQLKVKVADRTVIETTDAERRVVSPKGLQNSIDDLVSRYPNARAFVRPSGTEDIVRVYVESDTQANADSLAHEVSISVYEMAGGVGEKPLR